MKTMFRQGTAASSRGQQEQQQQYPSTSEGFVGSSSSFGTRRKLQDEAGDYEDGEVDGEGGSRGIGGNSNLIDLVDLEDFNVQVARISTADAASSQEEILIYELTDLITEWMNGSYERHLRDLGYSAFSTNKYADFDTVILLERKGDDDDRRRDLAEQQQQQRREEKRDEKRNDNAVVSAAASRRVLQSSSAVGSGGQLYTAEFKGAALFTRNATQEQVPDDVVRWIQQSTLQNRTGLLRAMQLSSASGLGHLVVDINTYAVSSSGSNGNGGGGNAASGGNGGNGTDGNLEIIIIVAVAVAAVAFIFLIMAIFWAWRYDRRNREAYLVGATSGVGKSRGGTRDASDPTSSHSTMELDDVENAHRRQVGKMARYAPQDGNAAIRDENEIPMSEIGGDSVVGGGIYPESVISEDISTSLSQYYRSGLASGGGGGAQGSAFADHHLRRSGGRGGGADHLNDAASVSSMESYGYSLDGYAPSMIMMQQQQAMSIADSVGIMPSSSYGTENDPYGPRDESAEGGTTTDDGTDPNNSTNPDTTYEEEFADGPSVSSNGREEETPTPTRDLEEKF